MIRKVEEQLRMERENVCGGTGKAHLLELFSAEEMEGRARMFQHITLEPGASFGAHRHFDEAEMYYVLRGELVSGEPGEREVLHAGDATLTGSGKAHFLRNETDAPAEFLAIILGVGSVENITD